VHLRDQSDNLVPTSGVAITVSAKNATTTPTLMGATTVLTTGGVATFSGLGITGTAGRFLFSFASASPLDTVRAADTTVIAMPLALAFPVSDTGGVDQVHTFVVDIPAGDTLLVVNIGGGTGSADLWVKYGQAPDPANGVVDCFPRLAGSEETCSFRNPAAGRWYVSVVGFPFSFEGVILTVNAYP